MASKIEYTAKDCLKVVVNGEPVREADDSVLSYMRDSTKSIYCYTPRC